MRGVGYSILAIALLLTSSISPVSAGQATGRSVVIGTSAASASTTYAFSFTLPSTAITVKSVEFKACTTASGTCTTPTGFSSTSSTLLSQPTGMGNGTWTVDTAVAGSLRIVNATNTNPPAGSQTVGFSNVVNPSATNATFFLRMATYTGTDWTTGPTDVGNFATSTAGEVTVTASVDETLVFTLGATTVPLGTLTTSSTGSGTSTMSASTNASNGYSITVAGTTLTSGANTITALATPTASTTNSKQFGLNLMSNSTPAVGTNVSGAGSGVAATGYNTADLFKFVSGDVVASATIPTNSNTYTTSYIANIDGVTAPGSYSTVLRYVATANF